MKPVSARGGDELVLIQSSKPGSRMFASILFGRLARNSQFHARGLVSGISTF
jgi:hypothetical protein